MQQRVVFFFAAHLDLFVGCCLIFSDSTIRFINKKNITSFWNGKIITLPETNSSPLKIGHYKRKFIFQPSIFRCKLAVSFREGTCLGSLLSKHFFKGQAGLSVFPHTHTHTHTHIEVRVPFYPGNMKDFMFFCCCFPFPKHASTSST